MNSYFSVLNENALFGSDGQTRLRAPMLCKSFTFQIIAKAALLMLSASGRLFGADSARVVQLPPPRLDGTMSVERAIAERRSVREYGDTALSLQEVSQLLWSAQGVTSEDGLRAVPSAGATYPLELYVVVSRVSGLERGVYHYVGRTHRLERVGDGSAPALLTAAAHGQEPVEACALAVVITSVTERTAQRYGTRAERYVTLEAGHAAQNILLEVEALGLAAVPVGAFEDSAVQSVVRSSAEPLYIIAVGKR
jgi:SagB-type dehydrogenase family enzyme